MRRRLGWKVITIANAGLSLATLDLLPGLASTLGMIGYSWRIPIGRRWVWKIVLGLQSLHFVGSALVLATVGGSIDARPDWSAIAVGVMFLLVPFLLIPSLVLYALWDYAFREHSTWHAPLANPPRRPWVHRVVQSDTQRTMLKRACMLLLGTINVGLVATGVVFMVGIWKGALALNFGDYQERYVWHFFAAYSGANALLLVGLALSAYLLFRFNPLGVSILAGVLVVELFYWSVLHILVLLPGFGMSAAGAQGIGNMGIAPQHYIAYPWSGLLALAALSTIGVWHSSEAVPVEDPR